MYVSFLYPLLRNLRITQGIFGETIKVLTNSAEQLRQVLNDRNITIKIITKVEDRPRYSERVSSVCFLEDTHQAVCANSGLRQEHRGKSVNGFIISVNQQMMMLYIFMSHLLTSVETNLLRDVFAASFEDI